MSLRVLNRQKQCIFVLETILYKMGGLYRFLINLKEVAKSSFKLKNEVVFRLGIICYSWSQYGNGEWTWTSWIRYLWHTIIFLGIICCLENSY